MFRKIVWGSEILLLVALPPGLRMPIGAVGDVTDFGAGDLKDVLDLMLIFCGAVIFLVSDSASDFYSELASSLN